MNKQEKHLADDQLQPIYYYEGKVTICLLRHERGVFVLSRGVAICSPSDQFIKRIGRARALGMALRSLKYLKSWGEIRPLNYPPPQSGKPTHPIWQISPKFKYRSTYLPQLTLWERVLLDKIIQKEAERLQKSLEEAEKKLLKELEPW